MQQTRTFLQHDGPNHLGLWLNQEPDGGLSGMAAMQAAAGEVVEEGMAAGAAAEIAGAKPAGGGAQ